MKVGLYVGNHAGDSLAARAGWWVTRNTQKGDFGNVTHVEAIHAEHTDGSVTIASASLRDGGVRDKVVVLQPDHWRIVNVGLWDVARSVDLLAKTKGRQYDWRGALATRLPGRHDDAAWFCNEWVGYPFLREAWTFGPHQFAAVCLSIGRDITHEFFEMRKGAGHD